MDSEAEVVNRSLAESRIVYNDATVPSTSMMLESTSMSMTMNDDTASSCSFAAANESTSHDLSLLHSSSILIANESFVDDESEEPVDPRVQIELERLNKACSDINKFENELKEAKNYFYRMENNQFEKLENLQKRLGDCIIKARPYFDTLKQIEYLQNETQLAAQEYQKAISLHKTAKETLSVAELSLERGKISDAWQEHMSTTITKINQTKRDADKAEEHHRKLANECRLAEQRLTTLRKECKKNIEKSMPYYEEKMKWTHQVNRQRDRLSDLEMCIAQSKAAYKEAMFSLSRINEEIHDMRQQRQQQQQQHRRQQRRGKSCTNRIVRSPSSSSAKKKRLTHEPEKVPQQQRVVLLRRDNEMLKQHRTPTTTTTTTTGADASVKTPKKTLTPTRPEIFLIDPIFKNLSYTTNHPNLKSK